MMPNSVTAASTTAGMMLIQTALVSATEGVHVCIISAVQIIDADPKTDTVY